MTPKEIRETQVDGRTDRGWLREIALQLALLNESRAPQVEVNAPMPTGKLSAGKKGK